MSYNITTFKVEKLNQFIIPVASLYKCESKDWRLAQMDNNDETVTFTNMGTEIHGVIKDGYLFVDKISCCGEGSGIIMAEVLEPAFEDSTGRFVALCVWEGGDSINQLVVDNGSVFWRDIDTSAIISRLATIADAWNAQADEFNQWDALGEDEKVEFAAVCGVELRGDKNAILLCTLNNLNGD